MDRSASSSSIFVRRLCLLGGVMCALVLGMCVQLYMLTSVRGEDLLERARSVLLARTYYPSRRGDILDRTGRRLVSSRPGYSVAVPFDVLSGAWERRHALADARAADGASRWGQRTDTEREHAIDAFRGRYRADRQRLYAFIREVADLTEEELQLQIDVILQQVQVERAEVHYNQEQAWEDEYGDGVTGFSRRPIAAERSSHQVVELQGSEDVAAFRVLSNELLPGLFTLESNRTRVHDWAEQEVVLQRHFLPRGLRRNTPLQITVSGVGDHLFGRLGAVDEHDYVTRPFTGKSTGLPGPDLRGYRLVDDMIGRSGLEASCESVLRGSWGVLEVRRDNGKVIQDIPQVPGDTLHLTIDIVLQATVQAILDQSYGLTLVRPFHENTVLPVGAELNAAAVVLEIETGEILAMASMPTRAMARAMDSEELARRQPWLNRPAEGIYPPGSTIKPLVLIGGLSDGVINISEPVTCNGHFFENIEDGARCWCYRPPQLYTHGSLLCVEAMARSCNIYFYETAHRLGLASLAQWYERFSLGRSLQIGLTHRYRAAGSIEEGEGHIRLRSRGESSGSIPGSVTIERARREGRLESETIFNGIGQSSVTWTPIQAANAYATIARNGRVLDATLLRDRGVFPRRRGQLVLDPHAVELCLSGLKDAVDRTYGTGNHITYHDSSGGATRETLLTVRGVDVWGKTGTAQAPIHGTHAWFIGLTGRIGERPQYAVAVLVEHGGSGGKVAAPIANAIFHVLQEQQFLPGSEMVRGAGP